jgi:pimeloyl-ACP methyl ester carboxylesterase
MLDTLGIEKTILAGNSMGGYVALAAARFFPERLSALALVASHAYADSPEKQKSRLSTIQMIEKEGVSSIFTSMPEKLSYNKEVVKFSWEIISRAKKEGVIGALSAMAERQDSIDVLTDLEIPVMIIAGQEDQIIPMETSRKMTAEINDAELIEIQDAGHLPMLDNASQTAAALLELINNL